MSEKETIRDFHLHTVYSDGLFTPYLLLNEAIKQGVSELSITDHDSIDGLAEGRKSSKILGINFVIGVELTTSYKGMTTHVLGYSFNPRNLKRSPLYEYMSAKKYADNKWAQRVARMSQRNPLLVNLGRGRQYKISINVKELEKFSLYTKPSYFHFGLLVKDKIEKLISEFKVVPARHIFYFLFTSFSEYIEKYQPLFKKYGIEKKRYWYVPREGFTLLSTNEVIEQLLQIGAVPVIAHPGESNLMEKQIEEMIEMGIKGIEVYTPKHNENQMQYYEEIADSKRLFSTSGTDFHDNFHRNKVKIGEDRYRRKLTRGITAENIRKKINTELVS
jgi:predicted metal-dependent phosphoesterase TrpH